MHLPEGASRGSWSLADVVEDLEQIAVGDRLRDRDEEVTALRDADYAELELSARLHGVLASPTQGSLEVCLLRGQRLRGRVVRVGADFFVLESEAGGDGGAQWAVAMRAVSMLIGLGERAVIAEARPMPARLGLRALLRELADQWAECLVMLGDGGRLDARVVRVGADFVELETPERGDHVVVPLAALAGVCLR